ncbi:ABC transporter ATP-binding protein [Nocardia higoensis]|uniref:ABC transporter ATP-binding protein n=1 Tax=Nocardia higoensis TaxID=228599 RepID=UPI0002FC988F|nr:ABC transporter ATP-binding protein [Nocardia higoensis]
MSSTPSSARARRLLEVEDLTISFGEDPARRVEVVSGVSMHVDEGETVCLVGESGSGKTVTGLSVMGLLDPRAAHVAGRVELDGQDLLSLTPRQWRDVRGSQIAMVFQEPMTALDPVYTVGAQLVETLRAHLPLNKKAARSRAVDLLDSVGIADPGRRFSAYPHEMSGGMRQRVAIALALACEPRLIVADEPTTAVDVTIQAQLLRLFQQLSREHGTAILMITHDLGVVAEVAARVYTLYNGRVVESGEVDDVIDAPRHPYTAGLLAALPEPHSRGHRLASIPGRVPRPGETLPGCSFQPRCGYAVEACSEGQPALLQVGPAHNARCIRATEPALIGARG